MKTQKRWELFIGLSLITILIILTVSITPLESKRFLNKQLRQFYFETEEEALTGLDEVKEEVEKLLKKDRSPKTYKKVFKLYDVFIDRCSENINGWNDVLGGLNNAIEDLKNGSKNLREIKTKHRKIRKKMAELKEKSTSRSKKKSNK